jgi:hypothetical protein
MSLLKMLIGRRLGNREAEQRKITTLEGLPAIAGLSHMSKEIIPEFFVPRR